MIHALIDDDLSLSQMDSIEFHKMMSGKLTRELVPYEQKYTELYDSAQKMYVGKKYGQGGSGAGSAGYYSPTQVWDKWSAQFGRGRLLRNPPKRGKLAFTYYYDSQNRPIMIEDGEAVMPEPNTGGITFLFYDNDERLYLTYFKSEATLGIPILYSGIWATRRKDFDCYFEAIYSPSNSEIITSEVLYKQGDQRGMCYRYELLTSAALLKQTFTVQFGEEDRVLSAEMADQHLIR